MIVSATGPRPQNCKSVFGKNSTKLKLKESLLKWFQNNAGQIESHLNGAAIGFDQYCMEAAFQAGIPVIAYLPCKDQDKFWDKKSREKYASLLTQCKEVIYLAEEYYDGVMFDRNKHLVNDSNYIITLRNTVENRQFGGTYSTLKLGQKKGSPILNFFTDTPSLLTEI